MKVLLDTNAYSAMRRGHLGVAERIRRAENIVFSSIVAGELIFGFRAGNRYAKNAAELDKLLDSPFVTFAPVSMTTADRYGRIASALKSKGKPIPSNDIWIAAHALEHGADLMSFDEHFRWVDGLAWINPATDVRP